MRGGRRRGGTEGDERREIEEGRKEMRGGGEEGRKEMRGGRRRGGTEGDERREEERRDGRR